MRQPCPSTRTPTGIRSLFGRAFPRAPVTFTLGHAAAADTGHLGSQPSLFAALEDQSKCDLKQ